MKISLSRRSLLSLVILGVAVCAVAFTLFSAKPFLAHADAKTLEGTWSTQTHFVSGPRTGQTETGTIVYAADGTLTSQTSSGAIGTGTWSMTSKLGFHSEFTEQIYQNGRNIGYVTVVEDGTLSKNAKTDSAQGTGTLSVYTPGGTKPVAVNGTVTDRVRIKKAGNGGGN